jgi:ribosomal protein L30E
LISVFFVNLLQKKTTDSLNNRLALCMKSGKYTLGYKSTLKSLRKGTSKLVLIASNCPPLRKSEIEYYAMLAKSGVHQYSGSTYFHSIFDSTVASFSIICWICRQHRAGHCLRQVLPRLHHQHH